MSIGRTGARVVRALDPMRLAGLVLLAGIWWALAQAMPPALLPAPQAVLHRMAADFFAAPELSYYGLSDASLLGSLLYTVQNVVLAVVLGTALGIAGGLVSARSSSVRAVIDPVLLTAGTIPILVAAPFLLIWFGVGRSSAVALVVFQVTVLLYLFSQRAADNLDPTYEDAALMLGASPRRVLRDVLVPGTVPEILGGLRIALASAWGLEAIAELLGAQEGIGKIIEVLAGATDVEGIMAALLLLGTVAIGADALMALAIARLTPWAMPARVAPALSRSTASPAAFAAPTGRRCWPCPMSASPSAPGNSSAWSARPAAARARCCRSSPGCSRPAPAACASPGARCAAPAPSAAWCSRRTACFPGCASSTTCSTGRNAAA